METLDHIATDHMSVLNVEGHTTLPLAQKVETPLLDVPYAVDPIQPTIKAVNSITVYLK